MTGPPLPLLWTTSSTATMLSASEKKGAKKSRRKHTVPEVGSLYDIMHEHSGLSLFVLPICWSDIHAQLLDCRFTQLPPQNTPTPSSCNSPRRSPARTSRTVVGIGRDLDTLLSMEEPRNMLTKNKALRNIMSALFPNHMSKPKSCAELDFRFGGRVYTKAVRCQVLWKHPDANLSFDSATTWTSSRSTSQLMSSMNVRVTNDSPILGFVSRSHLDHIRRNCFRIVSGPKRAYNGPVHRLQTLRSKQLIPSNPDEDPYFIAAMIAMAQQSVYMGRLFSPRDVKVRLMTMSEEDESFIVYTATVPDVYLKKFHEPHVAPQKDPQLNIEHIRVPIWPVLGLKERLGQALGKEVAGDFDELNIDMFSEGEEEEAPIIMKPSPKRRREVLPEVLNSSFSEDQESNCNDDDMATMGKRRCLEEGVASKSQAVSQRDHDTWLDFEKTARGAVTLNETPCKGVRSGWSHRVSRA